MDCISTAKLKLHATPDQFRALRQTQLASRDALNFVSRYAFAHGKRSNQMGLQEATYLDVRAQFGLPAQRACNVPRQVGATYKTLWTKVQANTAARAAGTTKKRYRGLDQVPKYVSPTLTYNYQRDYSFKTGRQVSVLTLQGRVILPYTGYARHVALIQQGARIGAAKLWYDKPQKRHGPAAPPALLSWHSGACPRGPLGPAAEALAAQRHSLGDPTHDRDRRARATVEARSQP